MKEAMKPDRARVQIAKMSIFGLLEISRQRMHSSFVESNYVTCPYCRGQGVLRSTESGAIFPEMQLHLANGKTFTVLAPKVNKENIYIQSIKIDGKPYDKTYLTHEQIMSGATVEFEMSNTPKAIGVIFEDKNP